MGILRVPSFSVMEVGVGGREILIFGRGVDLHLLLGLARLCETIMPSQFHTRLVIRDIGFGVGKGLGIF